MIESSKKIDEMRKGLTSWIKKNDYKWYECNYVPEQLFTSNHRLNVALRTLFRLCPLNLRCPSTKIYPLVPQSNVALLKSFIEHGNSEDDCRLLYNRILQLRSPKTKHFALQQGIQISINLYENSKDDPTPLNTVWFAQSLLKWNAGADDLKRKDILLSIADYIIDELGYVDHGEDGVYFYYGSTLKKEVYNASAIMSSFLIQLGYMYNVDKFKLIGERGIKYIIKKQNKDGSWFYAGPPERPTIDCFHQSYILQALIDIKALVSLNMEQVISEGIKFYYTQFHRTKKFVLPIRYDSRFTPRNTWLFQKIDGRDISEAIVFFSKYHLDRNMLEGLINLLYYKFYNKKKGCCASEQQILCMNKIPYMEFQAWYLYALNVLKNSLIWNEL